MGFEDTDTGSSSAITDYAIGRRGIDRLAKTVSRTTRTVYPIFDGHGNMVTLGESGTRYTAGDNRQYDAWGNILNSDGSGDPKGRYCANLGHKQDDESGLIYMRARYEDPATGRFTNEDRSRDGTNWATYGGNDPVNNTDMDGKALAPILAILLMAFISMAAYSVGFLAGFELMVADLASDDPRFQPNFLTTAVSMGAGGIAQLGLALNNLAIYRVSLGTLLSRAGPVAIVSFPIGAEMGAIMACLAYIDFEDEADD